jgi:3-phytase
MTMRFFAFLPFLAAACAPQARVSSVAPSAETAPSPSFEDSADDPAIWFNSADPERSLILGTDKQTGLYVYDLTGAEMQRLPIGPLNNVDLRQMGPSPFDLAVASNDGRNVVSAFSIDRRTGAVTSLAEHATGKIEPYGICLGAANDGYDVFVTYKDGTVQAFRLTIDTAPAMNLIRTIKLDTQLEGCVVDEAQQRLFVGEEAKGVWSIDLGDANAAPMLIDAVGSASGLTADVEGVSLWRGAGGKGWLVVSAQGASRFIVYDRSPPHAPRGAIRIKTSEGPPIVDAVTGTDGLDVASTPLGANYPRGLLVVQDDLNTAPDANQNFKLVDWRDVEAALDLDRLEPEQ